MQPFGLLTSLILHTLLFLLAIFWPVPEPKKINEERYLISMVIGEMGGENLPSPVAGIRAPQNKTPSILPDAKPAASETPKPAGNAIESPRKEIPKEMPEATPIPKKQEEKPKPPKEAAKAPEPKPAPPKKEKKTEKKQDKPKQQTADNAVKDALNTAKKETQSAKTASSALAALAELEKMQEMGGGGGSGSGNGGGGIYDVYAAQVILAVQPNWSMPTYSRQNLVVQVRIKLDIAGTVMSVDILESSGRADFDASAVNAVLRTKTLPKPPTKEQQDLIISFNSLELAGN